MAKNKVGQIYSLSRKLYLKNIPFLPKVFWTLNRVIFSCDLPFKANISESVTFSHNGLGVVINPGSIIGENTLILQHVTLGGNMGKSRYINGERFTAPRIGSNVVIGAGAKILGPVIIGDNVKIGANSVVLKDVPDGAVAVGIPARVLRGAGVE